MTESPEMSSEAREQRIQALVRLLAIAHTAQRRHRLQQEAAQKRKEQSYPEQQNALTER